MNNAVCSCISLPKESTLVPGSFSFSGGRGGRETLTCDVTWALATTDAFYMTYLEKARMEPEERGDFDAGFNIEGDELVEVIDLDEGNEEGKVILPLSGLSHIYRVH